MVIEFGVRQSGATTCRRYYAKLKQDPVRMEKFRKRRHRIMNQRYARAIAKYGPEKWAEVKAKRQKYYQEVVKPKLQAKKMCDFAG